MVLLTTLEWLKKGKIIVVVRGLKTEYMLGLAEALYAGGIDMMEVTFGQSDPASWKDTAAAIRAIATRMEGKMLAGAGTVLTEAQLRLAADAGARYIIQPNVNPAMIQKVKMAGLCSIPGAFTPTEIEAAWEAGADAVKVFPAGSLGPAYMKAVKEPLSHVPILAVGGVTEKTARDYIAAGCAGIGVSSRLVNKALIEAGDWAPITALAREFRKAVDGE